MKWTITKDHAKFFQKHGIIEFTGFVPEKKLLLANAAIDEYYTKELKVDIRHVNNYLKKDLFMYGRDLWRKINGVKNLTCDKNLASIAAELNEIDFIQLGFDQLIETTFPQPNVETLATSSSLQAVLCGVMICLSKSDDKEILDNTPTIFPSTKGSITYFSKEVPIDLSHAHKFLKGRYLMIAYVKKRCCYILQKTDPVTYYLKNEGYVYGDNLLEEKNPILYK